MEDLTYDKLAAAIQRRGGGMPIIKCQDFRDIMEILFTEEEARLAAILPENLATADMLVSQTNHSRAELAELLEGMARKGLLFAIKKQYYVLLPLVPGIIENQIATGIVNDRTKKLARLFQQYFISILKAGKVSKQVFSKVPFARIIAVDQNIRGENTVMPYDKLLPYIDKAEHLAVVVCHCRQTGELLDNPCTKYKDVCLTLGESARFIAEYGLGKPITREQAHRILERAEEEGLVHSVSNTEQIDFICNCCICHCELLRSMKKSVERGGAAVSSFVSVVNTEDCIGCGDCIARCPMEAITLKDEIAEVNGKRCIGCGLCVSKCPTEAIKMINREQAAPPYADNELLNKAVVASLSPEAKTG